MHAHMHACTHTSGTHISCLLMLSLSFLFWTPACAGSRNVKSRLDSTGRSIADRSRAAARAQLLALRRSLLIGAACIRDCKSAACRRCWDRRALLGWSALCHKACPRCRPSGVSRRTQEGPDQSDAQVSDGDRPHDERDDGCCRRVKEEGLASQDGARNEGSGGGSASECSCCQRAASELVRLFSAAAEEVCNVCTVSAQDARAECACGRAHLCPWASARE